MGTLLTLLAWGIDVLQIGLAQRIGRTGFAIEYPWLRALIIVRAGRNMIFHTALASQGNIVIWCVTSPVLWVASCGATLECYGKVRAYFRRVDSEVLRKGVWITASACVPTAAILWYDRIGNLDHVRRVIPVADGSVYGVCALLLLGQAAYYHLAIPYTMPHGLVLCRRLLPAIMGFGSIGALGTLLSARWARDLTSFIGWEGVGISVVLWLYWLGRGDGARPRRMHRGPRRGTIR